MGRGAEATRFGWQRKSPGKDKSSCHWRLGGLLKSAQGVHEGDLSSITWLFICFVLRGMECILVFINLGRGEEGGVKLPTLLAGGGDRPGEAPTPSLVSFLPPSPVTSPNWENFQVCHPTPHVLVPEWLPSSGPGCTGEGGSSRGARGQPFPPTLGFSFRDSVRVCLSVSLSFVCTTSLPSLSPLRPPFPSLFVQRASTKPS